MWDSVPTSMTLMMQFCYLKGKLKCRSLLGTLFPLPTNPFLPSCSTFLPHFFFRHLYFLPFWATLPVSP